jgi:hypothetical protein
MTLALCALAFAADFTWDWRNQEVIGRNDTSLGHTSKLTEPERAALIDTTVAKLKAPLTARGYDDARIREIASTTRVRFVDVGGEQPVMMATSFGIEGGCDMLANCPFWIFRPGKDQYVLMLESEAASYTIQPSMTAGYSDLVLARHMTPSDTRLMLYKFDDGKYADAGCYTAIFAPPKEGGSISDPEIAPCKAE